MANIKYLDSGEHFDLALSFKDTILCFSEHFDSFVDVVKGNFLYTEDIIKRVTNNYHVEFKENINSEILEHLRHYLNEENVFFWGDSNEFMVGKKFDSRAHSFGILELNAPNEFNVIYTRRKRTSFIMTLYHVVNRESFSCEKVEEKEIVFSEDGFKLPCSLEEMNQFLAKDEGLIHEQREIFRTAVFDCYSYYPNYVSKYKMFKECFYMRWTGPTNPVEIFNLYYWFSKPQYYSFAEICIQRNETDKIIPMNPYYTGEMPVAKKLIPFSQKADKLIQKLNPGKDTIKELRELQSNPKVGTNGINMLLEFFDKADGINDDRDYDTWIECDAKLSWRTPSYLNTIFETFDITPKVLIERTIREMFLNHLDNNDYWRYVCDYVEMCKQLNIEVEKKLPKDVLHKHDILKTKIKELENEIIEKKFIEQVAENKKLIEKLPDGNYTIISPEISKDLVEEGFRMNHCVGSYSYSYASGTSKIFFVRAKSNIDVPVATLELDKENRLVQISAFSNKKPDKDVMDYVAEWLKMIRKEGN